MKWKNLEINSILFLITNALFFLCGIHTFSQISLRATILSMLIGASISYLLLMVFFSVSKNYHIQYQKMPKVFRGILFFLSLPILNYSLTRITGFITYNVVSSIPYFLLVSAFLILVVFAVYKGIFGIIRSSFIYILTILFLSILTLISLFPKMDFQNILPLLDVSFSNILQSALLYTLISLAPYFYLTYFDVTLTFSVTKQLKKGFIFTQLFLIFYTLIIFSILGINIVNLYPYPEVAIFKKVSFLNIIDRMESIFSLSYFLSLFVHFVITFYGTVLFIQQICNTKKRAFTLFGFAFLLFLFNTFYQTSLVVWFLSYLLFLVILILTRISVHFQTAS